MHVVYASATGHVLGVRTGVGIGKVTPAVSDLVGPALLLRRRLGTSTVDLSLTATALGAATVADVPDALLDPAAFEVQRDVAGRVKPDLVRRAPGAADDPVTLTAASIEVDVGAPVTAGTAVLVALSGTGTQILTGALKADGTASLPARLEPDTYGVLLLVAGQQGRFFLELLR